MRLSIAIIIGLVVFTLSVLLSIHEVPFAILGLVLFQAHLLVIYYYKRKEIKHERENLIRRENNEHTNKKF